MIDIPEVIEALKDKVEALELLPNTEPNKALYSMAIEALEKQQMEIEHLMGCKEFESNLQRQIMAVGNRYMDIRPGKTYCVTDSWRAIQEQLPEPPQCVNGLHIT